MVERHNPYKRNKRNSRSQLFARQNLSHFICHKTLVTGTNRNFMFLVAANIHRPPLPLPLPRTKISMKGITYSRYRLICSSSKEVWSWYCKGRGMLILQISINILSHKLSLSVQLETLNLWWQLKLPYPFTEIIWRIFTYSQGWGGREGEMNDLRKPRVVYHFCVVHSLTLYPKWYEYVHEFHPM